MRPLATLAGLALLAAAGSCAKPAAPSASAAQQALIGASKARVLACAGQPAATSEAGGIEYLTYRREETLGAGHLTAAPRIPLIGSLAAGGPGHRVTCEATVILKDGAVEAISFRADPVQDEMTTAEVCTPLVQGCVSS